MFALCFNRIFSFAAIYLISIFRNYKPLASIVGGSLVAIFVLSICSETFLSSDGFEARKQVFGCLVKHLAKINVTDEYFDAAEALEIVDGNCVDVIKEKEESFYIDLKARFECSYPIYNVTLELCDLVEKSLCDNAKTETKPISEELQEGSKNVTELNKCYNLTDAKSHDKKVNEDTLVHFDEQSKQNCLVTEKCFDCIHKKLSSKSSNYDVTRLHAAAVNYTIIEFQVWKYFSISPRVVELTDEGKKLEEEALKECVEKEECKKTVKFCDKEKEVKVGH